MLNMDTFAMHVVQVVQCRCVHFRERKREIEEPGYFPETRMRRGSLPQYGPRSRWSKRQQSVAALIQQPVIGNVWRAVVLIQKRKKECRGIKAAAGEGVVVVDVECKFTRNTLAEIFIFAPDTISILLIGRLGGNVLRFVLFKSLFIDHNSQKLHQVYKYFVTQNIFDTRLRIIYFIGKKIANNPLVNVI